MDVLNEWRPIATLFDCLAGSQNYTMDGTRSVKNPCHGVSSDACQRLSCLLGITPNIGLIITAWALCIRRAVYLNPDLVGPPIASPFSLLDHLDRLLSLDSCPDSLGGRSRMLATSRQTHRLASPDRERKTSLPTKSNVDINDTLDGLRVGEQALLTTYTPEASSAKLLSQSTVLRIAVPSQSPSDSTTSPGRCPLERAATADPKLPTRQDTFQSNIIKGDDPRAVRPSESEHREQSVHSGSLELANQETTPQLQETQVPKKRRILEKVLAALRRKKLDLTESVPNEPPSVSWATLFQCKMMEFYQYPPQLVHLRGTASINRHRYSEANASLPPFAEAAGANRVPRSEASSSLNNVGTMLARPISMPLKRSFRRPPQARLQASTLLPLALQVMIQMVG
ncbi:hypothetical protein IMY05_C4483001100 [Salix suchowensis]|nr:hypothetical protein IMY05_C4483001100 [Salix suchowensis]